MRYKIPATVSVDIGFGRYRDRKPPINIGSGDTLTIGVDTEDGVFKFELHAVVGFSWPSKQEMEAGFFEWPVKGQS